MMGRWVWCVLGVVPSLSLACRDVQLERASSVSAAAGATSSAQLGVNSARVRGQAVSASGGAASGPVERANGERSPSPKFDGDIATLMTREHNQVRANVSAETPLPALTWSTELASSARGWAEQLAQRCSELQHRQQSQHGQNLAARASKNVDAPFTPADAVEGWLAEAKCWKPGKFAVTDHCDESCVMKLNSTGCGHYTQLIWRNTRELGCGYAMCEREGLRVEYWVCNYSPPGNVRGREPY